MVDLQIIFHITTSPGCGDEVTSTNVTQQNPPKTLDDFIDSFRSHSAVSWIVVVTSVARLRHNDACTLNINIHNICIQFITINSNILPVINLSSNNLQYFDTSDWVMQTAAGYKKSCFNNFQKQPGETVEKCTVNQKSRTNSGRAVYLGYTVSLKRL